MQRKNQLKKMKINYFFKEVNNNEKNYQLNMEILSSLKSLPGKVVNLQSEKYISKNEDSNKKIIFPEEKHTTSSSLSKELYNDPFFNVNDTEKSNKKLYTTTNSVFKPIQNFPLKKSTMNYYGNSVMSFNNDFLGPNPSAFNPIKITNSSYSKNSFYPIKNLDVPIINPINPTNTITQINPINTIQSFFPTFIPIINEQTPKNNDNNQTNNYFLLNKKRSAEKDLNLSLN